MTDAPKVTVAAPVVAADLHPTTPVVTAFLHNQIMAEAQTLLNEVYAAYNAAKAKFGMAAVLAFILGFVVGIVL